MTVLPSVTGKDLVAALKKAGFEGSKGARLEWRFLIREANMLKSDCPNGGTSD